MQGMGDEYTAAAPAFRSVTLLEHVKGRSSSASRGAADQQLGEDRGTHSCISVCTCAATSVL
jgi:hypothetical protein